VEWSARIFWLYKGDFPVAKNPFLLANTYLNVNKLVCIAPRYSEYFSFFFLSGCVCTFTPTQCPQWIRRPTKKEKPRPDLFPRTYHLPIYTIRLHVRASQTSVSPRPVRIIDKFLVANPMTSPQQHYIRIMYNNMSYTAYTWLAC